jgi:hypothetical protein
MTGRSTRLPVAPFAARRLLRPQADVVPSASASFAAVSRPDPFVAAPSPAAVFEPRLLPPHRQHRRQRERAAAMMMPQQPARAVGSLLQPVAPVDAQPNPAQQSASQSASQRASEPASAVHGQPSAAQREARTAADAVAGRCCVCRSQPRSCAAAACLLLRASRRRVWRPDTPRREGRGAEAERSVLLAAAPGCVHCRCPTTLLLMPRLPPRWRRCRPRAALPARGGCGCGGGWRALEEGGAS